METTLSRISEPSRVAAPPLNPKAAGGPTNSFLHFLQESFAGSADEETIPVSAFLNKGQPVPAESSAGAASVGAIPASVLLTEALHSLQEGSVGAVGEAATPASGLWKKGQPKKTEVDAALPASYSASIPAINTGIAQTQLCVGPADAGAPAGAGPSIKPDAAQSLAAAVSASVPQGDLRVEFNKGRETCPATGLAFALRLKPLTSPRGPVADTSARTDKADKILGIANVAITAPLKVPAAGLLAAEKASALPVTPAPLAKPETVETSSRARIQQADLPQQNVQAGRDPQSSKQDSSQGNHPDLHRSAPNREEKPTRTAATDTPEPVQGPVASGHALESRGMPPTIITLSSTIAAVQPPPAATVQPATVPSVTSLHQDDQLTNSRSAQEITLQVSSSVSDQKVDVRLVERGGEVHVSVRTPDVVLAHELRQDLGNLSGKLFQSGYSSEQFLPHSSGISSGLADQRNTPENQDPSGKHGQGSQRENSGQQEQAKDERGKRPAWIEEVEDSLAQRQTDRSTKWLLNR